MADNVEKLPNLAPRVIVVVSIICLALLLGQMIRDRAEQKELIGFEMIALFYQQLDFSQDINNAIMALSMNESDVAVDAAQSLLRTSMSQLRWTQDSLLILSKERIDENGADLVKDVTFSQEIDQIILYANEVLAEAEGNKVPVPPPYSTQYFHKETLYYISQLTSQLHAENRQKKSTDWWITIITGVLVFIVGLGFYRQGKKLVHRQFNELKNLKSELELESKRTKEHEQQIILESERSQAQKMKISAILNSTVDAIITITADGTVDSFNKAAEKMFGYSADTMIGENIRELMPEPYSSEHDSYLEHYHKTGEKKVIGRIREVLGLRRDGSEFPLNLSVSKVEGSKPMLFTGIVRDITKRKKAEAELEKALIELTQKQTELEEEERIARHVFENITASNNENIPEVSLWCEPMGTFSGDMMLSAVLPSGGIRIILCDFTGHGLPAALGAVPVSTIHSAMAKKGLPLEVLMNELNNKLNELLPTGIFCCIAGIDLDVTRTHAQIWNAGLPEVLVVSQAGDITQRIVSNHLPLGVIAYKDDELSCCDIQLNEGDFIYALSDGLTEAENDAGEMFGQQRLELLLMNKTNEDGRLVEIKNRVEIFVGKAMPTDDISLIEIKTLSTTDDIILQ